MDINGTNPIILEHMGDIYKTLDDFDQAILTYKRALENDKDNQLIIDKINNIYE